MIKQATKKSPAKKRKNNPFTGGAPPVAIASSFLDEKEENNEMDEKKEIKEKKVKISNKVINLNLKIEGELKNAFRVLSHKKGVSMTNYFRLLIIEAIEERVKVDKLKLPQEFKAFLSDVKKKAEEKVAVL